VASDSGIQSLPVLPRHVQIIDQRGLRSPPGLIARRPRLSSTRSNSSSRPCSTGSPFSAKVIPSERVYMASSGAMLGGARSTKPANTFYGDSDSVAGNVNRNLAQALSPTRPKSARRSDHDPAAKRQANSGSGVPVSVKAFKQTKHLVAYSRSIPMPLSFTQNNQVIPILRGRDMHQGRLLARN